jgi:hypothetical protein
MRVLHIGRHSMVQHVPVAELGPHDQVTYRKHVKTLHCDAQYLAAAPDCSDPRVIAHIQQYR